MADAGGESAAQRQARIRREKREAKIKAGGSERLDKITRLSGRAPESMTDTSPASSPAPTPPPARSPPPLMPPTSAAAGDPTQVRAQEEYLRSLLRAPEPQPGRAQQAEDPMVQMLNSLMGGGDAGGAGEGQLPFSADDLTKATGLPSFLSSFLMGQVQKPALTPAQVQSARVWSIVHVLFSLLAGLYVVYMVTSSTQLFGAHPPSPPTFQNPFLVFVMGELLLQGTQTLVDQGRGRGVGALWPIVKDISGDGSMVVFMLGAASWWRGLSQ